MRTRNQNLRVLLDTGIVVVIRVDAAEAAIQVGRALQAGGLQAIEISATTPGVMDAIRTLRQELDPQIVLGAGTVLDSETARTAILAGAEFIVSPISNASIIHTAHRYNGVVLAGALTPTEILSAWELGSDLVKVFPVDQVGGPGYIRAVRAPLPQVLLAPTGGVDLKNAADYIRAGSAVICIGSSLVSKELVRAGDWQTITDRSRELLQIVTNARQA